MSRIRLLALFACLLIVSGLSSSVLAQEAAEEDDEWSAVQAAEETFTGGDANDPTATQWSLQVAYEDRPTYFDDTMVNGQTRPAGNKRFLQYRMVAPLQLGPLLLLPRLTLRVSENQQNTWGLSPTDLFILVIPSFLDWGTGRAGLGPDIVFPASTSAVGTTAWQYGLAGAVIQRLFDDRVMVGILFQQLWGQTNPNSEDIFASPLVINPFLVVQLGGGFYIQNGDMVGLWDWQAKAFLTDLPFRLGYVHVGDGLVWNFYAEYGTTIFTDDWVRSAVKNRFRLNVSITIPLGS